MKLYGYSAKKAARHPMTLSEAAVECSIDEFEKIIDFLEKERLRLINWAKTRDESILIDSLDYTEVQPLSKDCKDKLLFFVNLESVINKYSK